MHARDVGAVTDEPPRPEPGVAEENLPPRLNSAEKSDRATEPTLTFRQTGMTFPDGTRALEDVSASVYKGEFVSLIGPSGCGKSTLLRIAAGLQTPTAGEVDVQADSVGFVFQDANLLPWRTVQRNVELPAQLADVPKRERRKKASESLELVGLDGFEHHYPKALSGGMKMRVSLARALTRDPPLFLLDEPFGALDEITRTRLNAELLKLFIRQGFAAVFVTHSIPEAVYLSTRVLVMCARPGQVVAEFDVPFPYPREPKLRFSDEFAAISRQVSAALESGLDDDEE